MEGQMRNARNDGLEVGSLIFGRRLRSSQVNAISHLAIIPHRQEDGKQRCGYNLTSDAIVRPNMRQ